MSLEPIDGGGPRFIEPVQIYFPLKDWDPDDEPYEIEHGFAIGYTHAIYQSDNGHVALVKITWPNTDKKLVVSDGTSGITLKERWRGKLTEEKAGELYDWLAGLNGWQLLTEVLYPKFGWADVDFDLMGGSKE
ncbi:hypothetical protein [Fictibacillus gelatini]|uniref:hypothetical protein n=1 Tax=Fictibacillus gelatini TaxID=225985 RepID=UPI0004130834|nr:hypothetical protein [Fictibacillus gelatini]